MQNLLLIGPGGEDGEALLGRLAGAACDGVLASTMSVNASWLMDTLR